MTIKNSVSGDFTYQLLCGIGFSTFTIFGYLLYLLFQSVDARNNVIPLTASAVLSIVAFIATRQLCINYRDIFINAGLFGIDLNKITTKRDSRGELVRPIDGQKVPEAIGVLSAAVYIVCISLFIPFAFAFQKQDAAEKPEIALTLLVRFVAALLTMSLMAFLGFVDNVLNLRWRDKLLLPSIASLPVLVVYFASGGATGVVVPHFIQALIRPLIELPYIELGPLFYLFLWAISLFSTNAINILAGVNGLEAGQSLVIAISLLIFNCVQLCRLPDGTAHQLLSIYLLLPFIGITGGLLTKNWFPAEVFVGDTFCYFAGMTFAVSGILGHYSKSTLLFFIPQIINFIYSVPQLFRMIPCPRHRMPRLLMVNENNKETSKTKSEERLPGPIISRTWKNKAGDVLIGCSYLECVPKRLSRLGKICFEIIRMFRLCHTVYTGDSDDDVVYVSNLTLINFCLYIFGPLREDHLCLVLLTIQVLCSLLAFAIRFWMASFLYAVVL